MPIIPRLQTPGPLAQIAAPVLDTARRPTANFGGVIDAVGRLGSASQMPLDNNDVSQGYRAMGAIGDAVMHAGSVAGALVAKNQEATDRRMINEAQAAMDDAQLQFRAWQEANPNAPESWAEEAAKRSEGLLKPFLEMKEISKSAKSDLQLMGQSWQRRFVGGVQIDGTKANFSLTRKSYELGADSAYLRGDRDAGDAKIAEAVRLGYLHEVDGVGAQMQGRQTATSTQLEQLRAQSGAALQAGDVDGARKMWREAELPTDDTAPHFAAVRTSVLADIDYRHAVNQELDALSGLGTTDPAEGLRQLKDGKFPRITGTDRAKAAEDLRRAQESQANQAVESARRAVLMMPEDKLKDAKPDALGIDLKQASPFHVAMIESMIEERKIKDPVALAARQNSTFAELYAAAGAWQPVGDDQAEALRMARFDMAADQLPPEMKKRLIDRRDAALGGDAAVTVTGPAIAEARKLAMDGAFGAVTKPVLADGLQVYRDPKEIGTVTRSGVGQTLFGLDWLNPDNDWTEKAMENDGKPVPVTEVDTVAKANSDRLVEQAQAQLERESKLPKNKEWTPDDARLRMLEIMRAMGANIAPGYTPSALPQPELGPNPLLPPLSADDLRRNAAEILQSRK